MTVLTVPAAVAAVSREDVVELTGQLCALARAGVGGRELWPALAAGRGTVAEIARPVAGMVAVGGSAADGLRLAADGVRGPGGDALHWLALTLEVGDRSGAPAAAVVDRIGDSLLGDLSRAGERDVALAGARATASVLAGMPLLGAALGLLLGVNTAAVLLGSAPGRVCLVLALLLWWAGGRWSARLIAVAERAGRPGGGQPVPGEIPGSLLMDLVAAVLQAGSPPAAAVRAVGGCLQEAADPRGRELLATAGELGTGTPARDGADPAVTALADGLSLAVRAGVAPGAMVRRAADQQRRRQAFAQQAAVRRLEIWLVAPAGLCWLPAFVLVGVVPLVIDLVAG